MLQQLLSSEDSIYSVSLNYTSVLRCVFSINTRTAVGMQSWNQSDACLHSGRTVHFHPSLSPRPSFQFFRGSGCKTTVMARYVSLQSFSRLNLFIRSWYQNLTTTTKQQAHFFDMRTVFCNFPYPVLLG